MTADSVVVMALSTLSVSASSAWRFKRSMATIQESVDFHAPNIPSISMCNTSARNILVNCLVSVCEVCSGLRRERGVFGVGLENRTPDTNSVNSVTILMARRKTSSGGTDTKCTIRSCGFVEYLL